MHLPLGFSQTVKMNSLTVSCDHEMSYEKKSVLLFSPGRTNLGNVPSISKIMEEHSATRQCPEEKSNF